MNLLTIRDLRVAELLLILRKTRYFKENPYQPVLKNKILAMLFEKPSTRTRVSFEVAMKHLGGDALFLGFDSLQVKRGETLGDTARVLSRYVDGIMARLKKHKDLVELARHATIPVINGLTDLYHPCQILGDMFTIKEVFGYFRGLKLAYFGDGNNNVTHSLLYACAKLGMSMIVASPKGYEPDKKIMEEARKIAKRNGIDVGGVHDPKLAAKKADIIYTDTWVSMGKEKEVKKRLKDLKPYQVNTKLLKKANKHCIVMHCLPAHREREITSEVMDGKHSVIWDQAENRLHVQKAILALLLK
jgi:ornithine carbamoyltransferase